MRPGLLAWTMTGLFVLTGTTGLALLASVPDEVLREEGNSLSLTAAFLLGTLAFSVVGAVVAQHQPRNPIGWLFVALAGVEGWSTLSYGYAWYSLEVAVLPAATYAAWFTTWASVLAPGFLAICFLLFPSGRLLSPRWRFATWFSLGLMAPVVARFALVPGPLADFPAVANPFGVAALEPLLGLPEDLLYLPLLGCAAAALVVRLRRARGVERQQLKWFAYSAAMIPTFLLVGGALSAITNSPDDSAVGHAFAFLFALVLAGLPVSAGLAILRYRLYDIDRLISRTLVYGLLTATLVATYLVSVLLFRVLLEPLTGGSDLAVAASTLAVAALFRPVRGRIQHVVDRRFYRSRYDATRTVEAFAARLRQEVDLDAVTTDLRLVVRDTVQPAHVSLWLRANGRGR
jgi:hypothetical protein